MKKSIFCAMMVIASTSLFAQSIKDLDFLIGTWDVSEVVFPGTSREYVETGVRECAYYLNENYIKCETNGIRKGRKRQYTFLFNYRKDEKKFRLLKLSSDFPGQSIKSWEIKPDLKLIFEEDVAGEQFISDISFEDRDKIIWRGWSPKNGKNPELQLIFREEAVRRKN